MNNVELKHIGYIDKNGDFHKEQRPHLFCVVDDETIVDDCVEESAPTFDECLKKLFDLREFTGKRYMITCEYAGVIADSFDIVNLFIDGIQLKDFEVKDKEIILTRAKSLEERYPPYEMVYKKI